MGISSSKKSDFVKEIEHVKNEGFERKSSEPPVLYTERSKLTAKGLIDTYPSREPLWRSCGGTIEGLEFLMNCFITGVEAPKEAIKGPNWIVAYTWVLTDEHITWEVLDYKCYTLYDEDGSIKSIIIPESPRIMLHENIEVHPNGLLSESDRNKLEAFVDKYFRYYSKNYKMSNMSHGLYHEGVAMESLRSFLKSGEYMTAHDYTTSTRIRS